MNLNGCREYYRTMKKIRVHPFFIVLCVLMILSRRALLLAATLFTVIFHEFAHYLEAKRRGYAMTRLTLMPYGAVLGAETGLADKDLFAVSAAGPLANLFFALMLVSVWWIFPASYPYTLTLFRANIATAVFNLLPLYPLDGSRLVLSFVKNKTRCLKLLRAAGCAGSFICAGLFVLSAFFTISYSLAIVSVMLFLGATADADREKYIQLCREIYYLKDFSRPIVKRELYVHTSARVSALLRELKSDYIYTVYVIDGELNVLRTLEGAELEQLFYMEKSRPMAAVLKELRN